MNELRITASAEEDYTISLRWYAERSQRAAEGFEVAFAQALEAIAANPESYPFCDGQHRFFLLRRSLFKLSFGKHPRIFG